MLTDQYLMGHEGSRFPLISAAAIVSAAMISGNAILFSSKNQIKGLTTSAALWATSLTGIGAGAGLYTATLILFVALFCVILFLPAAEKFLKDRSNHFEIHLELKNREDLPNFMTTVRKLGMIIDDVESNPAYLRTGISVYTIFLMVHSETLRKYKTHNEIIEALRSLDYVYYIEEMS